MGETLIRYSNEQICVIFGEKAKKVRHYFGCTNSSCFCAVVMLPRIRHFALSQPKSCNFTTTTVHGRAKCC